MAAGNKTLGRFELTGIPPAPRGTPQIEVTFDIDANGIVDVSATDVATGKQQSIRITASSGLTQEEIDRLVRDAELHAETDRKKKDLVDARNTADALIYNTEKSLGEFGDKVDASARSEIDGALRNLKRSLDGEDVNEIKRLTEVLTQASHQLAASVYQHTPGGNASYQGYDAENMRQRTPHESDEDVVDADYQEMA
jgi:molecular chaperone DnaK